LTIGDGGKLESWDLENNRSVVLCDLNVPCLAVSQTKDEIFIGSENGLKVFDVKKAIISRTIGFDGGNNGNGAVKTISIDKEGKWLVFGGESYYSTLLYIPTMSISAILPTSSETNDCIFGEHLVTVGNESGVYFWGMDGKFVKRMDTGFKQNLSVSTFGKSTIVTGMGSKIAILSKHLVDFVDLQ
jgi:WD40 repeat protein